MIIYCMPARLHDSSSYHESPHDQAEPGLVLDLINTTLLQSRAWMHILAAWVFAARAPSNSMPAMPPNAWRPSLT